MSKKSFALRVDAQIMDAMQRWADDDLRSLNAQIEWVLRDALRRAGRVRAVTAPAQELLDDAADDAKRETDVQRETDTKRESGTDPGAG